MNTQLSLPSWSGSGTQRYDVTRNADGTVRLDADDGVETTELWMTAEEARALAAALMAEADAA